MLTLSHLSAPPGGTEPHNLLQLAVAVFSTGPVGPSDMVGGTDVPLLQRLVTSAAIGSTADSSSCSLEKCLLFIRNVFNIRLLRWMCLLITHRTFE